MLHFNRGNSSTTISVAQGALVMPIRVLLAEMPPILAEIVRDIVAKEHDIRVIAEFADRREFLKGFEGLGVDVVVIGDRNPDDAGLPAQLMRISPRVRVIVIATSGRNATHYQLRPQRTRLLEVAHASIVEAIRSEGPSWPGTLPHN